MSASKFQRRQVERRLDLGCASRIGIGHTTFDSPAELGVRGPVQQERAERHGDRCAVTTTVDSAHYEIRHIRDRW